MHVTVCSSHPYICHYTCKAVLLIHTTTPFTFVQRPLVIDECQPSFEQLYHDIQTIEHPYRRQLLDALSKAVLDTKAPEVCLPKHYYRIARQKHT